MPLNLPVNLEIFNVSFNFPLQFLDIATIHSLFGDLTSCPEWDEETPATALTPASLLQD